MTTTMTIPTMTMLPLTAMMTATLVTIPIVKQAPHYYKNKKNNHNHNHNHNHNQRQRQQTNNSLVEEGACGEYANHPDTDISFQSVGFPLPDNIVALGCVKLCAEHIIVFPAPQSTISTFFLVLFSCFFFLTDITPFQFPFFFVPPFLFVSSVHIRPYSICPYLSIYLSVLSVCLFYLTTYLSIYLSIYLFISLVNYLWLSICPSICSYLWLVPLPTGKHGATTYWIRVLFSHSASIFIRHPPNHPNIQPASKPGDDGRKGGPG